MYDIHYLEKERLACIRLHGPVKGAEVQRAVTEAALQAGGAVTKVLLDYREVSAMDLTETDGGIGEHQLREAACHRGRRRRAPDVLGDRPDERGSE